MTDYDLRNRLSLAGVDIGFSSCDTCAATNIACARMIGGESYCPDCLRMMARLADNAETAQRRRESR